VFYPANKDIYESSGNERKYWMDYRNDNRYLDGFGLAMQWFDDLSSPMNTSMFISWKNIQIHAKRGLPLASHFIDEMNGPAIGKKKLVPLVVSHGFTSNKFQLSTICTELASFGYIVFAIDHHDGSATYSEKEDGTPVHFDSSVPRHDLGLNS
jgi:hypothetical protein